MTTPSTSPNWAAWAKRLLILGAIVGVVFVALTLILSRFLDPEALAARVEPRLEAALAREVDVGRVEVGFFPLGIRLGDVSVADPTGLAPNLATVDAVEFRVAFFPLFKKRVRVSRLVLDHPVADLRVAPGGRSNFGDLSPQEQPEAGESEEDAGAETFSLDLQAIRVSGGVLRFESPDDSTSVRIEDLRARASVRHEIGGPWVLAGSADGSISLSGGESAGEASFVPLSLDFDMDAGPEFEAVEIRSGRVGLDPLFLEISGNIDGFKEPVRTVALNLTGTEIPLDEILGVLADRLGFDIPGDVQGLVEAVLKVEGDLGPERTPDVSGTVALIRGGLTARDGTLVAQDISAQFDLADPDRIQIDIDGEILDGPFSADGTASLGTSGSLNLQVRGNPDLSLLQAAIELPEGVSAEGRLNSQLRVSGSFRDLRSLRFRGTASPTAVEVKHPAIAAPIAIPRGTISLVGNGATFVDLPVSVGTDRLVLTGDVQNLSSIGLPGQTLGLRGTVQGARLDLTKISPKTPPDPALTYGRVAFAHLGDRRLGRWGVEEAARELRLSRPDSLPFSGELQFAIDTVIYARGKVEAVRARTEFGPSLLRVTEASFNRFGGELWISTNLAFGRAAQQPFNLVVQARGLNAREFLGETTPAGDVIRGQFSLDLDLVGSLDGLLLPDGPSLMGSGRFSLTGGGLSSMPLTQALSAFMGGASVREPTVNDWSTSFIIENGRIRLADGRLAGTPGEPIVGGSIGFNGGLDLLSIFEINADNLGSYALDNLGIDDALAGRMAGRPGVVQAVVRIGGTILAPEFVGGPQETAEALTQGIKAEAQAEAERQIQQRRTQLQTRATGFLRGLVQRPDSTQTAPGDSTGALTLPTDSTVADSLRPDTTGAPPTPGDTVRPDTLRPDTLRPDTIRLDSIRPDTLLPDTTRADSIRPDTLVPDTLRPDTLRPDPPPPGTLAPDTSILRLVTGGSVG